MMHARHTQRRLLIPAALMTSGLCTALVYGSLKDVGPSMTLEAAAPLIDDSTVVLFNGKAWAGWRQRSGDASQWEPQADGSVLVTGGDAITEQEFGDFQLHLEFFLPNTPGKDGQAKSNSGVYLHGRYEVQVLDTYGLEPSGSGCGALYSIAAPMVNANRPPDTWQTYDMVFRAPRFDDDGNVSEFGRLTVLHNGIVIHNNLELPHPTPGGVAGDMVARGPILLQYHGDPVRYRNIWVRKLD